jgi:hypothetical protein
VFAFPEVVANTLVPLLAPGVIVHKDELSGQGVVEVFLSHQCVRAKHYLGFIWHKYPFVKVITHYELDTVSFEEDVILKERIAHGLPDSGVLHIL